MNALLTISVVLFMGGQSIARKNYGNKVAGRGACLFNAGSCLFAGLFFWVSGGFKFQMDPAIIPYSIGFAVTYGASVFFGFKALMCGPLSLTSLVTSYSLMIPTIYGLIFNNDEAGIFLYIGLVFLAVSLFCIAIKKEEKQISLRWAIYAALALFGNGLCSTILTVQQLNFEGAYKNEFMITALVMIVIFLSILTYKGEKADIKECLKAGFLWMIVWGVLNGATNLFVMMLSTRVQASLMYPLISGGGIILSWILSRFLYKEKLTPLQNFAVVLGVIAVVFLNL